MSALPKDTFEDRIPSRIEIENADNLRKIMASVVDDEKPTRMKLSVGKGEAADVVLSPAIAQTFLQVLRLISSGRGFRLMPVDTELTTQQAADLLNVSRPFLIGLLEKRKIPFTKTGRHRRIRAEDLFAYKASRDAERNEALAELARIDAENGLL